MSSLAHRDRQPELMDDPGLAADLHGAALRDLARLNRASLVARSLWPRVRALSPTSLLDVGCGGGDVAVALARKARDEGLPLVVRGCDRSSQAVAFARDQARRAAVDVEFTTHDALAAALPGEHDVVMCSLLLHHLTAEEAAALLTAMARAASRAVFVSDLGRSLPGLAIAWLGTRLLTRSPIVHTDALLSVRAAFTPDEALDLARRAGWPAPRIERVWPCRWLLSSELS